MRGFRVLTLAVAAYAGGCAAQQVSPPVVILKLPQGIPSESAQIATFMTGPFGGQGGHVETKRDQREYRITLAVDGNVADTVKAIAFMPGCRIVTLSVPVTAADLTQELKCVPVKNVKLHGWVSPYTQEQVNEGQITVSYMAYWAHQFFGIADGMVTMFNIGTARMDASGAFELDLPDLSADGNMREASFNFILRHRTTWNIIAMLKPEGRLRALMGLKVLNEYPAAVHFNAEKR